MVDLIVMAHAPLASALKAVASHAFADAADRIVAFDIAAADSPEDVERAVRAWVGMSKGPERLLVVDVFGATPFNIAQRLADLPGTRVLSGVNVPMLWRALTYQHLPLDQLIERAQTGGVQGVIAAAPLKPQSQSPGAPHDPTQHHHHQ